MSFIWNGVSSDTMKFNVTSRQVYNAPAYDLNAIEVPGRSGDLLNPQNRFKNKQISYTGFLKATDFSGSTWREKLSTGLIQLKGWLCSDAGTYHELTDDYDPGFTRYGYISGETAISDIEDRPFGVTLTVTFNCKPFMYMAGEPMELPETKSASGDIITITDGAENTPLKSAIVNIEPVQDLHGYDYPWPAGGGKNQMTPASAQTKTANGVTIRTNGDGIFRFSGTATALAEIDFDVPEFRTPISIGQGGNGGLFIMNSFANANSGVIFMYESTVVDSWTLSEVNRYNTAYVVIGDKLINKIGFRIASGLNVDNATISPMFTNDGSTSVLSFSPYSNICPISGWSEVNVWVKPTYDTTLTPTATIPLGRTVYGGTLDVLRGKLAVDRPMVNLGNFAWTKSPNGRYFYASFSQYTKNGPNEKYICTRYKFDGFVSSSPYYGENGTFRLFCAGGASAGVYEIYIHDENYNDAATFKNAMSEVQLLYLAAPQEYDVSPQTIKTLLGANNIWADVGEMSIEYPIPTENPYPFGSRPLYEITMAGTGTLVVNGKEWTITDYTGTLYCDTEAMEWYDASQLRNSIVSGDGWPTFKAGENSVSYTGDITKVMVTPRWRTL